MKYLAHLLVIAIVTAGLLGCGQEDAETESVPTPDSRFEVRVAPDLESCTPQMCAVVVNEYSYFNVEGFHYDPGYEYVIVIEQFKRDDDDHPNDAYRFGFRFIEVVSKELPASN